MKFVLSIVLLLVIAAAFLVQAIHAATLGGRKDKSPYKEGSHYDGNRTASFPRIYTAVVPCPIKGEESSAQNGISIAAEVDLIGIKESRLPSPYDGTDSSFCEISFLVRDAFALRRIELLIVAGDAPAPHSAGNGPSAISYNLQQDSVATNHLSRSMLPSDALQQTKTLQASVQPYSTIPGFPCYRSLAGIKAWMNDIARRANQITNLSIKLKVIGKSYKGYNITALVLTGNGVAAAGRSTSKAPMFIMAGIHPREYAPPELLAQWVVHLVNRYGKNADITSILDHTQIHLVLVSNPDGRQIAETNRAVLQRKNLHRYGNCGSSAGGVDLNRNFPFKWGFGYGSSNDPCSDTYRGPSAASEPEVKAIVNYAKTIFPTDQRKTNPESQLTLAYPQSAKGVFIDVHSYGENLIWPWGFQNVETPNDDGLETLVNKYKHFNGYALSGPQNGFTSPISGASDDWSFGTLGAAGMTFEIGTDFYQDCSYFNLSIVQNNIHTLTYAAKIAGAPYSLPKGPDVINITFDATSVAANGVVKVRPRASDSAWSASKFVTSKQGVAVIRVWVDVHPYDSGAGAGFAVGGFTPRSDPAQGYFAFQASLYSIGRHTIYFQATDGSGYKGPISAAYFSILSST